MTDPVFPGEDLPPRGRSLFDFLVAEKRDGKIVRAVPFPFTALLQRVDAQMRPLQERKGTPAVLIPLGRSLQRMAAAPDFFAYPRVVVAAVGEPIGGGNGIFLKDRLYFGYQEKANVLEVISYNEEAARFEFQVVTDYRAGGTPRIAYANRALCIACHQNAAPIFSRQVWDETNANPRIAALLAAQRKDFYGLAIDRGVDVPNAIDNAKLRANRFAVSQRLWTEGCGGTDAAAVRCRGALLAAVLQYRLSGENHFDRLSAAYRDDAVLQLIRTSLARWPQGLALGNPDIPNRNPLSGAWPTTETLAPGEWAALADITPPFDPLAMRPPLEIRNTAAEGDVARLVAELAEFIAEPDVQRVDRELFGRVTRHNARRQQDGNCRVISARDGKSGQRIEFSCAPAPDGANGDLRVEGRLALAGNAITGGMIDRLEFDGQPPMLDIDLRAGSTGMRGTARFAALVPMRGSLHARGADGNAFERFELEWSGAAGRARIRTVDDFTAARKAIAAMERDVLDGGFDGLSNAPFRRARLLPALFAALGVSTGSVCCVDPTGLPVASVAPVGGASPTASSTADSRAVAKHAGFHRYCGQCHMGADGAPPNFLAGEADAAEARLGQCAPRIFVRLSMARLAVNARAKTPMPPDVALHRLNYTADAWRDGEPLASLLQATAQRLRAETGRPPDLESLLRNGYEALRPCLAN
ncbi:MAG TPA: hypothetical protein PLW68_06615 [Casimicrobiaceae bacterium]|nr:hypothetical protein [Casimicrobiaceae bacterium]